MSPFAGLLRSRKFWLLMLDTVISLVLYFVGQLAPDALDNVEFVIGAIQPVFVMLIAAIAHEDAAAKANGTFNH